MMAEVRAWGGLLPFLRRGIGIPVLTLGLALFLVLGFHALPRRLGPPLGHLVVIEHGREVAASQVEALIRPDWSRGWLGFPLQRVRHRLERMPWVAHASLERVFPDTLVVTIYEQHPVARFGRHGLVNRAGDLFYHGSLPKRFAKLPAIQGPPGSLRRLVRTERRFARLLSQAGLGIQKLVEDPRGGYRIRLVSGLGLRLGQDRRRARLRLRRFLDVVRPALGERLNDAAYVDMRYVRGFAVGWRHRRAAPLPSRMRNANG